MTNAASIDERVRWMLRAANERALRDPEGALAMFAEAAELGAHAGSPGVEAALEAMGRITAASGDLANARDLLRAAHSEAIAAGAACVVARTRAALLVLERPRPYASAADALASELRHAADLLDAAQLSLAAVPSLHAARARLELRRRLATDGAVPPLGALEIALALSRVEVQILVACAALTLQPELATQLPPASLGDPEAPWSARIAAWLSPGLDDDELPDVDTVLADLAARGLVRRDADGRPSLAPHVDTLLEGRRQPAVPEGFAPIASTPIWSDRPPARVAGPAEPPAALAVLGRPAATVDHVTQLGWARGWPTWIVRARQAEPDVLLRGARALAREAIALERLLVVALHDLDPESAQLVAGELTTRLARVIVLAAEAPDAGGFETLAIGEVEP